jgi:hypothetical protein
MPNTFAITDAVLKRISDITTPHLKALNEDITEEHPEQPDMAFALALGFAVSILLNALSDPAERASAVNGINLLVRLCGYALTPVT